MQPNTSCNITKRVNFGEIFFLFNAEFLQETEILSLSRNNGLVLAKESRFVVISWQEQIFDIFPAVQLRMALRLRNLRK
jgi:hypothetical protein